MSSDGVAVRRASAADLEAIRTIYNEGIDDRVATLDVFPKSAGDVALWWGEHGDPFSVLVAAEAENVIGWASLNRFSHRCAHAGIADLSVYVARGRRGQVIGAKLLRALVADAAIGGFSKIVLHALESNEQGKRLYRKVGFVEVGVFRRHGRIDDKFVDVVAMELMLE